MPSPDDRVQLVCFDLGGVLLRICRSWSEGCRAAGLDLRSGGSFVNDPSSANGRAELSARYQTGRIDSETYFRDLSLAVGSLYSPEEIARIHHAWVLEEYPRVGEVIDRVHDAGLRTAALSNTNHAHWQRMPEFPAFSRLQCPLASHTLGLAKPDEAIYREAESRFGVAGRAIVFFDDLPENIEAARRVGWRAVQIDHAGDTARQIERGLRAHGALM